MKPRAVVPLLLVLTAFACSSTSHITKAPGTYAVLVQNQPVGPNGGYWPANGFALNALSRAMELRFEKVEYVRVVPANLDRYAAFIVLMPSSQYDDAIRLDRRTRPIGITHVTLPYEVSTNASPTYKGMLSFEIYETMPSGPAEISGFDEFFRAATIRTQLTSPAPQVVMRSPSAASVDAR